MAKIKLTNSKKYDLIDDSDYPLVSFYDWYLATDGHATAKICGKTITMARFLLGIKDPKICADHINRKKLDDRRHNLRTATRAENARNRRKLEGTTSRFIGPHWHKHVKKWQVDIECNGVRFHVGYFENEEEAARAYDAAAKQYHGEFASLNFPNESA